jgi:transposase
MPRSRPPYPPEFRRRMVELVREFGPSAQTIRNWIAQTDIDEGRRDDGLTTPECEEKRRLRCENRYDPQH